MIAVKNPGTPGLFVTGTFAVLWVVALGLLGWILVLPVDAPSPPCAPTDVKAVQLHG